MGVYVKGMKMPTSCGDCKAFVCYRQWASDMGDCFCGITKEDAKAKEKNADCPLVPVPPHYDLIDHNALKIAVMNCDCETRVDFLKHTMDCINKAPVVIPSDMPTYEEEGEA